jgi:hypothetical protein
MNCSSLWEENKVIDFADTPISNINISLVITYDVNKDSIPNDTDGSLKVNMPNL